MWQDYFELGVILLRKKLFTQATKNLEKAKKTWNGEPDELAQVGVILRPLSLVSCIAASWSVVCSCTWHAHALHLGRASLTEICTAVVITFIPSCHGIS